MIGVASAFLSACAAPYNSTDYAEEATRGLLMLCNDAPMGIVGETNESLARAYLTSTESLLLCKGVSRSLME